MSGKQEKALRRALKVVEQMNAVGVTDRERIAQRIAKNEEARRAEILGRRFSRTLEQFNRVIKSTHGGAVRSWP